MRLRITIAFLAVAFAPLPALFAQTLPPDRVLYDNALKDIGRGDYAAARMTLNTLIGAYDSSPYLVWAKLAIADSWFRQGDPHGLAQAEVEYKDFEMFYPRAGDLRERITVAADGMPRAQTQDLIRQITPVYPPGLLARGVEGTVLLAATISKDGVPGSIKVVTTQGDERFAHAALASVRQWRYKPTLVNGRPINVPTTIQVDFKRNAR